MAEVIVSGHVISTRGARALVPAGLDPQARSDCAITLEGPDLPPLGRNAAARGELAEQRLTVSEWNLEPEPHPTLTPRPDLPGADVADVTHAVHTLHVADADMVSVGETSLGGGRRTSQVQVVRVSRELAVWLTDQAPGSVYVYPFVRDAGTPNVLTAGDTTGRRKG
jgi:hypothetical protein